MIVFPDTNVLLSAFFGNGMCAALFEHLIESDHIIIIGEPAAREFVRIARDKFQVSPRSLSYALEVLRRQRTAPAVANRPAGIPDPDDVPVVACALAAGAEIFVTGDKALLTLETFGDMRILAPRQLWQEWLKPT